MDAQIENAARRLPALEGGQNFRDMGGYRSSDGRTVRWRRLYRSGSMSRLTPADYETLAALNIKTVCDLRTTEERQNEPNAWAEAAGVAYWYRDYGHSFGELRSTLNTELATLGDARAAMIASYRRLPFEQAPAYREVFVRLSTGDVPLVFNCSVGKDRTGTLAALVLSALGVPRETIVEDYTLTNRVLDRNRFRVAGGGDRRRISPDVIAAALEAHPSYISAAFDAVHESHGSIEGYLADILALGDHDLAQLRAALLE